MNTAWFLLFFFNALVQKPLGFCLIDSDTLLVIDRFMVIIIFVEREQLRITPITWLFRLVCAYGVEYFVLRTENHSHHLAFSAGLCLWSGVLCSLK